LAVDTAGELSWWAFAAVIVGTDATELAASAEPALEMAGLTPLVALVVFALGAARCAGDEHATAQIRAPAAAPTAAIVRFRPPRIPA
jgi:hypothetical protein